MKEFSLGSDRAPASTQSYPSVKFPPETIPRALRLFVRDRTKIRAIFFLNKHLDTSIESRRRGETEAPLSET